MQETMLIVFYRIIAIFLLVIFSPVFLILFILVRFTSKGPFIFRQKRMGKNKKAFTIYKIRTMVEDAEKIKHKYLDLNEDDGPTFKIKNDPRYTKIGKLLSKLALDELPQLINVIRGEMSFVGPRPLPVEEALKIPKKYEARFSVLPGMTSSWIVKCGHKLRFKEWMELDLEYVEKKNIMFDLYILFKTGILLLTK